MIGERAATAWLWVLALTLPLGALLQPWVWPSRSALPVIPRELHTPLLLITVPGLRADRVQHLGHPRPTTPTLDRLLSHGVSFRRAYAASNDAGATLAALMASRNPSLNNVLSSGDVLPEQRLTLADRLGPHGYDTLAVLADPSVAGMGLEQGFQQLRWLPPGSSSEQLLAEALRFVDTTPAPRWFVWVDLPDLLPPYGGDFADVRRFAPDMPAGFACDPPLSFLDEAEQRRRGWGEQQRRWLSDRYDGALAHLDRSIGRFLDALDKRMLLQTMVVCVSGTRGESIGDRADLLVSHGIDLYEPSIHVPLLFRLPAQQVRGRCLESFARTVDVGPTLLQLALKSGPRSEWLGACGQSLLETITARHESLTLAASQGRHLPRPADAPSGLAEPPDNDLSLARRLAELPLSQGTRAFRFKLIQVLGQDDGSQLYDLDKDPGETQDRTATQPVVSAGLAQLGQLWADTCRLP